MYGSLERSIPMPIFPFNEEEDDEEREDDLVGLKGVPTNGEAG
jgi:hypothetical protein